MIRLPASRQRALDRIEQSLAAEDPDLGLRFALFTRLTRDETMPGTEQVPGRLQRIRRPAIVPPLIVIGLVALLAASWLIPIRQYCLAGPVAAAHNTSSASRAARCHSGPPTRLSHLPIR